MRRRGEEGVSKNWEVGGSSNGVERRKYVIGGGQGAGRMFPLPVLLPRKVVVVFGQAVTVVAWAGSRVD